MYTYTTIGVSGAKIPFCLTQTQKVLSLESKVRLDVAHLRQEF